MRILLILLLPFCLFADPLPLMNLDIHDFDIQGNHIILKGGVHIDYRQDSLTVDDEIRIQLQEIDGSREFQSLASRGRTKFVRRDEQGSPYLTLISHGIARLDKANKELLMDRVDSDKQVCFHDHEGKVYADRLVVLFDSAEGSTEPKTIKMEGKVRIYHRFPGFSQSSNQYALADQIVYEPGEGKIAISAAPGKRVLFVDRMNHLQMSAPGILILRDPVTGKETVKGIGDVRFKLKKEEQVKISKLQEGSDE